jgi:hypothetical protein
MNFYAFLGIVFIVLKLTNVIDWSWWLVLLPLYVGLVLAVVFFVIAVSVVGFADAKFIITRRKK